MSRIVIKYSDGSREKISDQRYLNRVWTRDAALKRAKVRLASKEHLESALWRWAEDAKRSGGAS